MVGISGTSARLAQFSASLGKVGRGIRLNVCSLDVRSVTDRSQTTTSSYPLKTKDKMKSGAVITFTDLEFCNLFIYEIHVLFFLLKPEILRAFNVKSYLQEINIMLLRN